MRSVLLMFETTSFCFKICLIRSKRKEKKSELKSLIIKSARWFAWINLFSFYILMTRIWKKTVTHIGYIFLYQFRKAIKKLSFWSFIFFIFFFRIFMGGVEFMIWYFVRPRFLITWITTVVVLFICFDLVFS